MGTKNNPGAFDCYANALPDEPMFVLLGRDKHAPTLVWLWATMREIDGEDPAKVVEARECAMAMVQYAHAAGRPSVGLGMATLAGFFEVMRAANAYADRDKVKNEETELETLRRFLAYTRLEK